MWFLYHMFNSVTMYYLIWLLEFSYINVHTYFFLVLQTFSILEYCFCNNRLLSNLCLCLLCELFMVLATTCLVFYWAFYCQYFWPLYSVPANTRRSEFHVYLFFFIMKQPYYYNWGPKSNQSSRSPLTTYIFADHVAAAVL